VATRAQHAGSVADTACMPLTTSAAGAAQVLYAEVSDDKCPPELSMQAVWLTLCVYALDNVCCRCCTGALRRGIR